ncbi:MAG: formylglycine-generating enzyme family protein, partial [Chloroflexi bacterium]|nr:formylglycine-generating enzyme family protein [Chloroflexota bacterium]
VTDEEADQAVLSCIADTDDDTLCFREFFIDAQPVQEITLSAFFIDVNEVTNAAYAECVASEVCTPPSNVDFFNDAQFADHPVVYVSYQQANQYCLFAGKRMVTEAEWEKAARWDPITGESRVYPWGDIYEPGRANTLSAGQGGTAPVSAFMNDRSALGLQGLGGNVREWVSDWYFPNYDDFPGASLVNPTGPATQPLTEPFRVARGGSWQDFAFYSRGGHRWDMPPASSTPWLGFRCAQTVEGAEPPVVPTEVPAEEAPAEEEGPVDGPPTAAPPEETPTNGGDDAPTDEGGGDEGTP